MKTSGEGSSSTARSDWGLVVLGPYRSGTSLAAWVAAQLGVDFGPEAGLHPPSPRNPLGYFERIDVNEANNGFIGSAGGDLEDPGNPETLIEAGNREEIEALDWSWARQARWGVKDPRHCFTLNAWLQSKSFPSQDIRVLHVQRDLEAATTSAVRDPAVSSFAGGDRARIRTMLQRYAKAAQWQVQRLDVPVHALSFETLLAEPREEIRRLASFLGCPDQAAMDRAERGVGKRRGLARFYLREMCVRWPRRAAARLFKAGEQPPGR